MNKIPKRRRDKYNPYRIFKTNDTGKYHIIFKDSKNELNDIEVTEDIYNTFNYYELKDVSQMNEYDNHIEHSIIFEDKLNQRSNKKEISIEESIINKIQIEKLYYAISQLSRIQKIRIIKYYFLDKNEKMIAKEEKVTQQSIHISLKRAKLKLKEILEEE